MAENEDLELQALQRLLDDAFETTRPRRGFEDELWLRMQARRPLWTRIRDGLAGLWDGAREAPAVPLAAVAVVLIAVVGVGILHAGGLPSFTPTQHTASMAGPGQGTAADKNGGRLPSPALHPGLIDAAAPGASQGPVSPAYLGAPSNLYFGPAMLTWNGQFPISQLQAPVYRYVEPTSAQTNAFATSIGAGATVSVRGTVPQLPREPFFTLTPTGAGAAGGDPQQVATAFLDVHRLLPTWPDQVVVVQAGDVSRVLFERAIDGPVSGPAYVVDWNGERYGVEVDVRNGGVLSLTGPIPIDLTRIDYQLISNSLAAQMAVAAPAAGDAVIRPTPTVALDSIELVYALAVSGGQGFYEPAYLFSGTFQYNGQAYVKRVLVPLVDPSLRSS
jgi:hypothetical protein